MRIAKSIVEQYFSNLSGPLDPGLKKSRQAALELGLQQISLGDLELQILKSIILLHASQKWIEIGTLTGSSGLAILSALPQKAHLWTFEKEILHAELAKPLLEDAAHSKNQQVEILIGDARLRLKEIEHLGPFDGIFIDGNKAAYGDYLVWAESNIRKGGLVIADNIFLSGAVFESVFESERPVSSKFSAKQINVMKAFNQRLMDKSVFETSFLPTEEGLSVSIKL